MSILLNPQNLYCDVSHTEGLPAESKINKLAKKLLSEANNGDLAGQEILIEASSEYVPLVYSMVESAYRDFQSAKVQVKLIEPEIEKLKNKYGVREGEFDYQKKLYNKAGTVKIKLDDEVKYYRRAGLSSIEIQTLKNTISPEIDIQTAQQLEQTMDPDEVVNDCLTLDSISEKQPLYIEGTREHMPQILRLVEAAFKKGQRKIDLNIQENYRYDFKKALVKHAPESVVSKDPWWIREAFREYVEKNCARFAIRGKDLDQYADLNETQQKKIGRVLNLETKAENRSLLLSQVPWSHYYIPCTGSAKAAGYKSLGDAAIEAKKINRVGSIKEHVQRLKQRTEKLNDLVEQGYRTLRFVNKKTGTNFTVGLTEKSIFSSTGDSNSRGQEHIANTPSEEHFTAPDITKADGQISTTRPAYINGTLVSDIVFKFKEGRLVYAKAQQGDEALQQWLKEHKNVDRIGELGLVAGSPIFDLGRVHNLNIVDENACCHFALGTPYDVCIKGAKEKMGDEKLAYLKSLNCNTEATAHMDFMFGDEKLEVYIEKDPSDSVSLINNNEWSLAA